MKFIVVKMFDLLTSDNKPPVKGARKETVNIGGTLHPDKEEVWVVQYDSLESFVEAAREWESFKIVPNYCGKGGDNLAAIEIYDEDYYYDYYYDYFKDFFGE